MTEEFEIGEFDPSAVESGEWQKEDNENVTSRIGVRYEKYSVCDDSKGEYIPCLDNVEEIMKLNLSGSVDRFERLCPKEGKRLDCLVPMPKGYRRPIPWPKSRDEVKFCCVQTCVNLLFVYCWEF